MNGLQGELQTKAPALFRLFLVGEGIYFAGMLLMATGLGASLGPNPLAWPSKFRVLMSAESPGLAKAKLFWLGFLMNAFGSLTFASIGLYVAITLLPHGAPTLIPASLMDLAFSLFVRYGFYRKFSSPGVRSTS